MDEAVAVDLTDPCVVLITWGLTWGVGRFCTKHMDRLRHLLPVVALVLAVGARASLDTMLGVPLSWDSVFRGVASAGTAVLGHSQFREAVKALATNAGVPVGEAAILGAQEPTEPPRPL